MKPKECERCGGIGIYHLRDCFECNGTGYADKIDRDICANCGALVPFESMHVSPDEDGNRNVCEPCVRKMDAREQSA